MSYNHTGAIGFAYWEETWPVREARGVSCIRRGPSLTSRHHWPVRTGSTFGIRCSPYSTLCAVGIYFSPFRWCRYLFQVRPGCLASKLCSCLATRCLGFRKLPPLGHPSVLPLELHSQVQLLLFGLRVSRRVKSIHLHTIPPLLVSSVLTTTTAFRLSLPRTIFKPRTPMF